VHNLVAAQASPGTGTSISNGMYNLMLNSPLDGDIRQDVVGDIATKMPQLSAQPGPGNATAQSFKNIQPGLIMIDSMNFFTPGAEAEVGNVTVDSIEIREYDAVLD
jgi:hypothetical protein